MNNSDINAQLEQALGEMDKHVQYKAKIQMMEEQFQARFQKQQHNFTNIIRKERHNCKNTYKFNYRSN